MRLMHGIIKDMKSRTIVGNCRSEKCFGVDVHRGSVLESTALNCYVRGSNSEQTAHSCYCTKMIP